MSSCWLSSLFIQTRRTLISLRPIMSASPPHKRLRSDGPTLVPTSPPSINVSINEAPVRAMLPASDSAQASLADVGPSKSIGQPKAQTKGQSKQAKRKTRRPLPDQYSAGDVLFRDVRDFLGPEYVDEIIAKGEQKEWEAPEGLETYTTEVTLRVGAFTVSGESLSLYPQDPTDPSTSNPLTSESKKKWAILVPFAHPGDLIRAKIIKHDRLYTQADLLEIIEYSETYRGGEGDRRQNPEAGCRYFKECGGCQLQEVPYPKQLEHKKTTVTKAYTRFSGLSSQEMPPIQDTIGSPKQWGYRTKIKPHFDAPPKYIQTILREQKETDAAKADGDIELHEENTRNGHEDGEDAVPGRGTKIITAGDKSWELRIGFERKGRPGVMDIEECPIATPTLNAHLVPARAKVHSTITSFRRGATLLLRDSLPIPDPALSSSNPFDPSSPVLAQDQHVPITDHHAAVFERVGQYMFQFSAGSFFQNNNSILVPLLEYVREAIFPTSFSDVEGKQSIPPPTHLVDTYCGSGLFGISLSKHFERIAGVEISDQSIKAAKRNADMNGLQDKTSWLVGKAEEIFGGLEKEGFRGRESCVVVDPPRKGCDTPFLKQLLDFAPQTIVYVSCNVHTQARDVGWFVREAEKRGKERWVVESVRGFDLFPQTAHVESVAVLRLDSSSVVQSAEATEADGKDISANEEEATNS